MTVSKTFYLSTVGTIQDISILIAVILFYLVPKHARRQYAELGILLVLSVLADFIAWIGILAFHKNMNLVSSIFTLIKLPLFIFFYRKQVELNIKNSVVYSLIGFLTIVGIINLFFIQGLFSINSYTRALNTFFYTVISMTYLFNYSSSLPKESRIQSPMYWINAAILFYHCATFFILLWVDYLVNVVQSNLINIWIVHNSLGIVYYAMLGYAFALLRTQHNKSLTA